MIGLILMVPPLNLFHCSTSTLPGRRANLTLARYVTTLTTISSNVPTRMSRLEVSHWSVRFPAGWLPIENLLSGEVGKMIHSKKSRAVLTIRGMDRFRRNVQSLAPPLYLRKLMLLWMLSWMQRSIIYHWLRMMVLLLQERSLITHSPKSKACSHI